MENHDPITAGQIGKVQELIGAALRKTNLLSAPAQSVLEHQGGQVIGEMVAVFQKYVEAVSDIIIRHVRVDRSRTPQQVLDATGRKQYVDPDTLATMPKGEGDEVDVWFIPTKRYVPAKEVPAFLAQYGLVPDPRAQAAVNEADPAFADEHPNGSQWGDNYCLTFYGWNFERRVYCSRSGSGWLDHWFLSGVPAPRK